MNIDLKSTKVQMSIGIPTLLAAALALGDYRWIDSGELQVVMHQVTNDRREDQLYSINKQINRLEVQRSERKLRSDELQRLLDWRTEKARLIRLLKRR